MKKKKICYLTVALLILISTAIHSQDFGFGFDNPEEESSSSAVSFKTSGEISAQMPLYFRDFDEQEISFWDMVSAKLNFTLSSRNVEAFAFFNLNAWSIDELFNSNRFLNDPSYTPLFIDEAFLRAYIGTVNIEAGFRKLSWGRMDGQGPLDITNPVDYTDLRNITDLRAIKIARPMLHVTWNTGNFSKLEGVFIPNFTGHRFDMTGRWAANQITNMPQVIGAGILDRAIENYPMYQSLLQTMYPLMADRFPDFSAEEPRLASLENFQGGLRFTATIGSADIGVQYFYGTLFRPGVTVGGVDEFLADMIPGVFGDNPPLTINPSYDPDFNLLSPQINYTRYHQIGLDYAQVLLGFNLRAELALHLTQDLSGDDGSVANPFIGWAVGFDRDLFLGINLNFQCDNTIRLLNDKIGNNPVFDSEADTDMTSTRITVQLSRSYLMDRLESKLIFIWNIENSDFYIIPSLVWSMGNLTSELTAGFFTGNTDGEFGQYWKNSFIRLGLTFLF